MDSSINIKLISRHDHIEAGCFDFDSIISTIEEVFKQNQNGLVELPDKISQIFDNKTQARINCMPATLFAEKTCGMKWVSVFPDNPHQYGLPNVSGLIILSEIEKGLPFAVMDGTLITALRTACMGAIGAKYLAREDSKVYGTIGAGEQARMHFRLIKYMLPGIKTCYIASRTKQSETSFANDMSEMYPDVDFIPCNSDYEMASKEADVIVTAISCQAPLLKASAIKQGAFYCHVGGWEDEYAVPLMADKIVCDDWDALKHRGSPTIAKLFEQGKLQDGDIYGNIGELITGRKPGRENKHEFIYFNSIGLGFVDVAVALSFYKKCIEKNLGQDWIL